MRSLGMKLVVFAAVAMLTAPVFAQTDTYGAKADVVMEIHPSKIIDSPLGKKMEFAKKLAEMSADPAPGQPDLSKLVRVFAGLVAPENVEKMEEIQEGQQNDMKFFVRLEFSTAEAAKQVIAEAMNNNVGKTEKNGRTYYQVPDGQEGAEQGFPTGTVMYQVNEKVVELASKEFAYRSDTDSPMTDRLATAWKAMPNKALKISVDGVNARGLMKSLAEDGKKTVGGNPIAGAILDLFPTMDNINLSVDLASANLLTLQMAGSDKDKSVDIHDAFKALMTLVKPGAKQGIDAFIGPQAPEAAAVLGKLVSGMDVTQEGNNVALNIPRPDGFEDATVEVIPVIQMIIVQMALQGMGGGAPPASGF